jgi:hypothetical protein
LKRFGEVMARALEEAATPAALATSGCGTRLPLLKQVRALCLETSLLY